MSGLEFWCDWNDRCGEMPALIGINRVLNPAVRFLTIDWRITMNADNALDAFAAISIGVAGFSAITWLASP